jgi:hypothetical protein
LYASGAASQRSAQRFTLRGTVKGLAKSPSRDLRVGAAPRPTSHIVVGVDASSRGRTRWLRFAFQLQVPRACPRAVQPRTDEQHDRADPTSHRRRRGRSCNGPAWAQPAGASVSQGATLVSVLWSSDRRFGLRSLHREDTLMFTIAARAFWTIAAATHYSGSAIVGPADRGERTGARSLSDREQRLLALEELHAIGLLDRNELVAETTHVLELQPARNATSPELPADRQSWRRIRMDVVTRRFRCSLLQVVGGLGRSFSSSSG